MKLLTLTVLLLPSFTGFCQHNNAPVVVNVTVLEDTIGKDTTLVIEPARKNPNAKTFRDTTTIINPETGDETVFIYVEQMPQASYSLEGYLKANSVYPATITHSSKAYRVAVQFKVLVDGSITDVKVVGNRDSKAVNPKFDSEAIRLIKAMPKWEPSKRNGKPVQCQFTLPIIFKAD